LPQVHEQLSEFVDAVHDVPELRDALRNPQLESWAKSVVVSDLVGDADELVRNFLLLTSEKGRIGEIEEIGKEFERLMAREERRLRVALTTARELSDAEANEILSQIEKASGRQVEATRTVDPDLIGGIVLRAGSLQVDASVRGRLERLRHELARS
jgi:ATP synthase F1 delta subunit